MPALSDTMGAGRLVKWTKKSGEKIKKGDVIAEVETDKAVMEVEAFQDGYLSGPLAAEGSEAPVGQIIGYIADNVNDIRGVEVHGARAAGRGRQRRRQIPPPKGRRSRQSWPRLWRRRGHSLRGDQFLLRRFRWQPAVLQLPRRRPAEKVRQRSRSSWARHIGLSAPPVCARPSPGL